MLFQIGKHLAEKWKHAKELLNDALKVIGTDRSKYGEYEEAWRTAVAVKSSNCADGSSVERIVETAKLMAQIRAGVLGISVQRKRLSRKGKILVNIKCSIIIYNTYLLN